MSDSKPQTALPNAVSRSIVLYGAGSQTHVLQTMIEASGFHVVAVFNDRAPSESYEAPARIVVGPDAIVRWVSEQNGELHYAITIGNQFGRERTAAHEFLERLGLLPVTLTSGTAFVDPSARLGRSTQILPFAFVGARARIGDAVILNTRASVDHECHLGDGVHVGPSATLAGRVKIGKNTFLGSGSVVCPDLDIAADTIIGAGAVVTRTIDEPGTYVGVPARRIK